MHLFITGGAGYIGSACAQMLIEAGHTVTIYDNLSHGHRAAVPDRANFIHGDLGDRAALAEAFAGQTYDAVLHFAALIEAGESMRQPGTFFRANVAYSNNLIETAVAHGVRRMVFSSTAAVYASSEAPLSEEAPLGPTNVYGQTKLMIEQMLGWYGQIFGLRYAVLRYFNACGALPGRGEAHQPESHLIPRIFQVALGQQPSATIFGVDYPTPDGTCIRDYIHIADLVSAHQLALTALADRPALTYNLGNGAGYSVRQVIDAARAVTGHAIPVVEKPRRPGDAPRLVAAADKIQRELGWQARQPALEDILGSAWEWHRSHPHGYA